MMTKKRKKKLIIAITVVFLILIIAGLITIYLLTDMFKSSQTLFMKYLGQNTENLEMITEALFNNDLNNSKYEENTQIKVNYTQNIGTTSENTANSINNLKIMIEGQIDKQNKYNYKNIKLDNKETQVMNIECIQNGNNYGIKFSDLFSEYLLVENNNLKEILKKVGISEEKIPDTLQTDLDILENIKLNQEEMGILKNKYTKLISENTSKQNFSKKKNQTITINQKSVFVNEYTLTLTKEQLNNLFIKILENIKEDEIILKRITTLQEYIERINAFLDDPINLNEMFTNKVQKTIEDINKNNIGNEETKIIVYENAKQPVRISIQEIDYQIDISFLGVDGKFAELSIKENESEVQKFAITKTEKKFKIEAEDKKQKTPYTLSLECGKETSGGNIYKNTIVVYETNEYKIQTDINKEIKQVEQFEEEIELNEKNSIQLDELEEERLTSILDRVTEKLNEKIENVKEQINSEDLIEVGKSLGIIKKQNQLSSEGITEAEKNRFNSKFQFLKIGELNNEEMLETIDAFAENLIDLEIVSGTELKVKIDRNNNNEEYVKILKEFVGKDKSRKYNVSIEYDRETGLAKYVIMTIVTN